MKKSHLVIVRYYTLNRIAMKLINASYINILNNTIN